MSCPVVTPAGIVHDSFYGHFALILTIFYPIFALFCVAVFLYYRSTSVYLRKRNVGLMLFSCGGTFVGWSVTVLYDTIGSEHYPCALLGFLTYMAAPLVATPLLFKLAKYMNEIAIIKLNKELRMQQVQSQQQVVPVTSSEMTELTTTTLRSGMLGVDTQHEHAAVSVEAPRVRFTETLKAEISWRTLKGHINVVWLGQRSSENRVLDAKFTRGAGFTLFYMTLTVFPYLIVYLIRLATESRWHNGCFGCEIDAIDAIFLATILSFSTIICVFTLSMRVHRRDSLRIVRECLYTWYWGGPLSALAYILLAIDPNGLYRVHGQVDWKIFILLSYPWTIYSQTLHQVIVAKILKYQLIVSNHFGRADRFADVMKDKTLKEELKQHLNRELSSEILMFLEAVDEFKALNGVPHLSLSATSSSSSLLATEKNNNNATTTPPNRASSAAASNYSMNAKSVCQAYMKRIYDSFVKKGAPNEINIGSNLREDILIKMVQNNQNDTIDFEIFDEAYEDVKNNLLKDGFARFLNKLAANRLNPALSKKPTMVLSASSVAAQTDDGQQMV